MNHEIHINFQDPSRQVQLSPRNIALEIKKLGSNLHEESFKEPHYPQKTRSKIEKAGFLSMLHFTFGIKLIRFVNSLKTRTLQVEDLDPLGYNESSETLEGRFTQEYQILKEKGYKDTKLIGLVLARIFKKDILLQFVWQAIFALSRILAAYFMYLILSIVRNPAKLNSRGYFPAIGLFICYIVGVYALHQFSFNSNYVLNKIKTGFTGMLFRKITRLSHHAVHIMNLGKLINLTANDINNFERIHFLISLVLAPLILIGGWALLMSFWGTSSFVGIGYMAFIWIIQVKVSRRTLNIRRHKSSVSDERNRTLIEGIEGIKTLKLFTWEFDFIEKIRKIRGQEVKDIKAFNYLDSISRAFSFSSHWIGSYLIYLTYCLRGGTISTVLTFPTIYLLGFLRQLCLFQTFQALTFIVEMRLASRRICSIMDLSEAGHKRHVEPPRDPDNCAEFREFSAYWVSNDFETDVSGPSTDAKKYYPVISNINLDIKKGSLVTIIGDNGSGKSSLLLSFTGEIAKYTGELRYKGRYAYVAQEKVCFSGPLKDSIVFGKTFEEEYFWEVLEACCIADEIRKLPKQEMTEIRERGANLSEGFRARVALARAVYSKADIYLLDACWSNLDTKLEKKIFRNCIQGLLKGKTVIMVTHQLHLARYASHLIVMEKGEIIAQGTYEEVIERDSKIKAVSFMKRLTEENQSDLKMHRYASVDFQGKIVEAESEKEEQEKFLGAEKNGILSVIQDPGLFYEGEQLDEWKVTYKVYWRYFKRIFNWFTIILFLALFIGNESTSWLFTIFIDKWGKRQWTNTQAYIALGPVTILSLPVGLIKYIFYFYLTLNAADKLHDKMLTGVFKSPAKFFDKNPSGRIMNRFSNDIGILDKFLMASLLDIAEGFFAFWITILALWTTNAWLFIPFIILFVAYLIIHAWCYKALNQTRGLELTTRSPLYSLFLIGVNGLSVVRARGQSEDMIRSFYKRADDYSRANIAHMTAIRVMSFLMDLVIELIVIGTFAVFLGTENTPLMSGFFVNMLGNLPATVQWILRDFMKFHLLLASVARAINFCEHYKGAQLLHDKDEEYKEKGWPKNGDIEVKNAFIRYSHHSDWVLKNLSIDFKSKEKIAVFGNSKAGVSSLIAMLTRMYDIETPNGRGDSCVRLDNVDIQDVGLHLLRKSITVIRQDCFLLTGTIRDNLDPWKQHTDQEIWDALELVELRRFVEGLPKKLESRVSKGSHLFSMGEKQLLCIARGLLKNCLIFIQDEATAHLDFTKEQIIQKNLLKKYQDATVINITRRILTVCEYDKVLLIDNGNKVEYGEPYRLLVKNIGDEKITNTEGYLASFIVGMGPKAANEIFNYVMMQFYQKHKITPPEGFQVDSGELEKSDSEKSFKNVHCENTTINSIENTDSEVSSRETPNKEAKKISPNNSSEKKPSGE